jgi:thiosulfate reductase cytochrome b subunit
VNAARPAALLLATLAALGAPVLAGAQQTVNPIHPTFAPVDAEGRPARRAEDVSADRTCGACHDTRWIGEHSGHASGAAKATCIQCHVDGARLDPTRTGADGRLVREALRIGPARSATCAACHGVIGDAKHAVALPAELEGAPAPGRTWSLTLGQGAIFAPQRMSDSFLNLQGKGELAAPWDVHAAKLVDCVGCHYAPNDPRRSDGKKSRLTYVTNDPRRPSNAEFLVRPDHRLAEPDCRTCHDALAGHDFLPYRERHVEVLACQACHTANPAAPAAEMVDATVATLDGGPRIRLRNVDRKPREPLNAATIYPLRPLFVLRPAADGAQRLTPVNVVSRWRWISRADGQEVPFATVARAWLDGGRWAEPVLKALDQNLDGRLDDAELRLDTPAKVELIAGRLRALGVREPAVDGVLEPHVLGHGISSRDRALRDCEACHSEDSHLKDDYVLASYLPGGVLPRPPEGGGKVELTGAIVGTAAGGLALHRDAASAAGGLHILGLTRQAATNRLGFGLFVAVALGVAAHGLARVVARRRRGAAPAASARAQPDSHEKEYVFGRYERMWHWTMATSGIVLILTGLQIHNAGWRWPVALSTSIWLHNALAVVLILNSGLALFYQLTTAAIRHFFPHPKGLLERTLAHLQYQSRGIFVGDPHPHHPGHKLNPLQQVTYLSLLGFLFPLQIATGALIWAVGHWPKLGIALGGLHVIAPVHNLVAWLFLAFFTLHTYLVTTGPTVGEHVRSMVTGYRSVPAEPHSPAPSLEA